MAPVLAFLRIIRFARDCVKCVRAEGASLLALLGRKLIVGWSLWFENLDTPNQPNVHRLESRQVHIQHQVVLLL